MFFCGVFRVGGNLIFGKPKPALGGFESGTYTSSSFIFLRTAALDGGFSRFLSALSAGLTYSSSSEMRALYYSFSSLKSLFSLVKVSTS